MALAKSRGRQFERFVKWFLKNDPEWATQIDQICLWNEYPGQWGRDCGERFDQALAGDRLRWEHN